MSKEKYGITDAHYICDSAIFNTETDEILRLYQICDLLNEQDQKIKELEVKLAERTKQLKIALKDFNDIQQESDKLAQQLAEKYKEIEYQESMKILAVKNQNQTAIIELEKVKEWMNKSDDDGYIFRFASMDTREKFNQKLDQQIKLLKGEKK